MLLLSVSIRIFLTVSDGNATQINLTYVSYIREVQGSIGLRGQGSDIRMLSLYLLNLLASELPPSQAGSACGGRDGCWLIWAAYLGCRLSGNESRNPWRVSPFT